MSILFNNGKCLVNRNVPDAVSMAINSGERNPSTSKLLKLCANEKAEITSRVVDRKAEIRLVGLPELLDSANFSHSLSNWRSQLLPTRYMVRRITGDLPSPLQAIANRLLPAERTGDLKQSFDPAQHVGRHKRMKTDLC